MAEEARKEKYDRQTKEQFEELGRFVQQFEAMVDAVRRTCLQLTTTSVKHHRLMNIILHHSSMTAWPLFEIARALYGEMINDAEYKITTEQGIVIKGVLKQISAEYSDLLAHRNNMVHGTWYIGWASPADEEFSDLKIAKYKATSSGFAAAETPKNTAELQALTERCKQNAFLINLLNATFIFPGGPRVCENFHKEKDTWVATTAKPG
jgi:hypothetical protein